MSPVAELLDVTAEAATARRPVELHRSVVEFARAFRRWLRPHLGGLLAVVAYLVAACYVTARLWGDVDQRAIAVNPADHAFFQWVLSHGARVVTEGANPLFAGALNVPAGVNLMANTSILGLAIPLTPVTVLFGPQASFAILLAVGLAGTASAWYWCFSRHLVRSRLAAAIAGGFCGFAPGMIAHTQAHPNWTAMFLVPFLAVAAMRLGTGEHMIRRGFVLGLLATVQAFINEEVLFYSGLAGVIFLATHAIADPAAAKARWRGLVGGIAVAGFTAAVLLAVPLWAQFQAPQSHRGVPTGAAVMGTDLVAYGAFPRLSIAGDLVSASHLTQGPVEENAFFGLPLLILSIAFAIWLRGLTIVRVAAVSGLVFAVLSLGPELVVWRHRTGIAGPWTFLDGLPLFDSVVPTRLSLVLVPIIGLILALAGDRLAAAEFSGRLVGIVAMVVALIPLVPLPIPVHEAPTPPEFISSGAWRGFVPAGRSMVLVPLTTYADPTGMSWSARSNVEVPIAGGYFLGPGGPDGRAIFGAPPRMTERLFRYVARTGRIPRITEQHRRDLEIDLAYWRAAVLVVQPDQPYADKLTQLLIRLLGPGERVGGVWLWDVRTRVDLYSTGQATK